MFQSSVLLILLYFCGAIECFGFHDFYFNGRDEPIVETKRSIDEKWIEQPLDHFDIRNNNTWKMRYYENDEFFNGNGSIYIMLGGEWEITTGFVRTGQLYENAKKNNGIMYYTEHRYYGKSHPVENATLENLIFLNVDQALADVAYFIVSKKRQLNIPNSKVFVFGCSYAGNMATWIRIKYPHLINGAIASSAPVRSVADYFEYYDVVANSLRKYDKKCTDNIKEAFEYFESIVHNPNAVKKIKDNFNLCQTPDLTVDRQISWIENAMAQIFAGIVHYNRNYMNGTSDISQTCDKIINSVHNSSFERVSEFIRGPICHNWNYKLVTNEFKNTSFDSQVITDKLFLYQTCSEFGNRQTSSSPNSIFGSLFDLESVNKICTDLYGEGYDINLLNKGIKRTNVMYGSDKPDVNHVIFVNGDIDPWHKLSVLENLNDYSPAFLIEGSSHCEYLNPALPGDSEELTQTRKIISSIISDWENSCYNF